MALTQESLLSFLLERGGKVKNSELVNYFRGVINGSDPAEKQHNRDLFKRLVNSVAVVKQVDEAKFVVVKKRYQDFVKDASPKAAQVSDSFSSQNTSFSCTSPGRGGAESENSLMRSDIENNNVHRSSKRNGGYCGNVTHISAGSAQERSPVSTNISSTVKVLNISADRASRARKSGALFAVIAVQSPTRDTATAAQDGPLSRLHQQRTSEQPTTCSAPPSAPPPPPTSVPTFKKSDALIDSKCWINRRAEDLVHPSAIPHVKPKSNKSTRQADEAKYAECVPLEPLAHKWLVKCAAGLWGQIYGLLLQDSRLAQKKDFMSGFTALHWAAKDGNGDMIHKLVDVSRRRGGPCVDVNCKAHGGYTPLHIAAMHGRTEVMLLLVRSYGANVNERDNHGKKALHYLGKGASAEVKALVGGRQQRSTHRGRMEDEEEFREQQGKGFNTISKLFHPHTGRRQKTATRCAQTGEDDSDLGQS